jgi:predicted Zn-dependent protease
MLNQKADEATIQFKRALELNPNDEVAWYRLARALRLTGDEQGQKKALAEFQRLHTLESSRLARAESSLPGKTYPTNL